MVIKGQVLYDSGRFPLWFRIPAVFFGLFVLWLTVNIATNYIFGVSIGFRMVDSTGSPLWGGIACLFIGLVWTSIWFLRIRIAFDTESNQLIFYAIDGKRKVSLDGTNAVRISKVWKGGMGRRLSFRVSMVYQDGRCELVLDPNTEVEATILAEVISNATRLPVLKEYDQKDPPETESTLTQLYMQLYSMIALLLAIAFLAFVMLYGEINVITCSWAAITLFVIIVFSIGIFKTICEIKSRKTIGGNV